MLLQRSLLVLYLSILLNHMVVSVAGLFGSRAQQPAHPAVPRHPRHPSPVLPSADVDAARKASKSDGNEGGDRVTAVLRRIWLRDFLDAGAETYYARVASGAFDGGGGDNGEVNEVHKLRNELLAQLRDPLHCAASHSPFASPFGAAPPLSSSSSWLRSEVAMIIKGLIDVGTTASTVPLLPHSVPVSAVNKTRAQQQLAMRGLFRAPLPRAMRLRADPLLGPPASSSQGGEALVSSRSPGASSQVFQQVLAGALAEAVPGGQPVLLDEGTLRRVHSAALRELSADAQLPHCSEDNAPLDTLDPDAMLDGVDAIYGSRGAGMHQRGESNSDSREGRLASTGARSYRITRSAIVSALLDVCSPRYRKAAGSSGLCGPVFLVLPSSSHPRDLVESPAGPGQGSHQMHSQGTSTGDAYNGVDQVVESATKAESESPSPSIHGSPALDLTSIRDVTMWLSTGTNGQGSMHRQKQESPIDTENGSSLASTRPSLDAVSRALSCNGVWTSESSCELIFDSIRSSNTVGRAPEDVPDVFVIETCGGESSDEEPSSRHSAGEGSGAISRDTSRGASLFATGQTPAGGPTLPPGLAMSPMMGIGMPMFLGAQAIEVRHHANGSIEVRQVPMPPAAPSSGLGPGMTTMIPSFMAMQQQQQPAPGAAPMLGSSPLNIGPLIGRILEHAQRQSGGKEGNLLASIEAAIMNATGPGEPGTVSSAETAFPVGLTASITDAVSVNGPGVAKSKRRLDPSPNRAMLAMKGPRLRSPAIGEDTVPENNGTSRVPKPAIRFSKLLRAMTSRNAVSIAPPEDPELLRRYAKLGRTERQTSCLATNLLRLRAKMNEAHLSLVLPGSPNPGSPSSDEQAYVDIINDIAETSLVHLLAERALAPSDLTLALVRSLLLHRGQDHHSAPTPSHLPEAEADGRAGHERNALPIWALAAGVGSVVRPSVSFITQWAHAARRRLGAGLSDAAGPDEEGAASLSAATAVTAAKRLGAEEPPAPATHAKRRTRADLASMDLDKYEQALAANVVFPGDINVRFDEVGGLEDIKTVLRQSVTYPLKYPWLYSEGIAADALKGLLLFGPPGTGKTMLAKAVASEGQFSFLAVDAAAIENKWLGESEKNAKALFSLARKLSPCIIYLDEVDSILSSREHGGEDGTHGALTSVKTTIMQEWDGLRSGIGAPSSQASTLTSAPPPPAVIVVASTNRPFDLDEAVLRRLPRRLLVDLPDAATRRAILNVTLRNNKLASDVNLTRIASEELEGYSGSDIKEVCREAVIRISHERAEMLDALERNQTSLASDRTAMFRSLRPVTHADLKAAIRKLRASVSAESREVEKLLAWNEKFGEVKGRSKKPRTEADAQSHLALYI